jgi:hypothetical protein
VGKEKLLLRGQLMREFFGKSFLKGIHLGKKMKSGG